MTRRIFFFFSLVSLGALVSAAYAEDFSADMHTTIAGQSMQGKIAVSGDRARMDIGGMVTIVRVDKGMVWMVMPQSKMYMQMPLDSQHLAAVGAETPEEMKREFLGTELLNGRSVEKYRVYYDLGERTSSLVTWSIPDSDVPLKIASDDGSWQMEYYNIQYGVPDPALFEIPPGYQQLAMPVDALAGIGGLGGLTNINTMLPPEEAGEEAYPADLSGLADVQGLLRELNDIHQDKQDTD